MARILIVDDEPDFVDMLSRVLAARGHMIDTARDGGLAIAQIELARPDLVVIDRELPKVDGLQVCRQMKTSDATLPIIMLTSGDIELDDVTRAHAPNAFLVRPFLRDLLVDNVERLLASIAS